MESSTPTTQTNATEDSTSPQAEASETDEQHPETPRPRQRAFLACIECRWRKRKCDVSQLGAPCTVCREHGRTCTVRRRQPKQNRLRHPEQNVSQIFQAQAGDSSLRNDSKSQRKESTELLGKTGASLLARPVIVSQLKSLQCQNYASSHLEPGIDAASCQYLKSNSMDHLPPEDVQYLNHRGCFHVPARCGSDRLIKEYFRRVHPHLPILVEDAFGATYYMSGPATSKQDKISLFVFQAMLFVSSSFLTKHEVSSLGFESIRDARSTYYRRAKALHDFGLETDPLAIAQGALLLTYYTPKENPKFQNFWLGVAIQQAKELHAHDHRKYQGIPHDHALRLKRLWWGCILRDRSLALGLRRSLQIPRVAMVTGPPCLEEADLYSEVFGSRVYTPTVKRSWMPWVNLHCQLAIYLTDVIEISYPAWRPNPHAEIDAEALERDTVQLTAAERQLDKWYDRACMAEVSDALAECVLLSQGIAYMWYHSAKVAIANQLVMQTTMRPRLLREKTTDVDRATQQLHAAVEGIAQNLTKLAEANLLEHLPPAVTCMVSFPMIWSVLGSKFAPEDNASRLLESWTAVYSTTLQSCQTRYEGTDALIDHLTNLIDRFSSSSTPTELLNAHSKPDHITRLSLASNEMLKRTDFGFGGVLQTRPRIYSHIVAALDIALSSGRMPQYDDFPASLQLMPKTSSLSTMAMMSLISKSPQHRYLSASTAAPQPCTAYRSDSAQLGADKHASPTNGLSPAANETTTQPSSSVIQDPIDLPYARGDQEVEMLHQLLEGYAEAGVFPGISTTVRSERKIHHDSAE